MENDCGMSGRDEGSGFREVRRVESAGEVRPAEVRLIDLERKVTEKNDQLAAEIRSRLHAAGVYSLNLLSGPGAGKTSLLERTLPEIFSRYRCLVVEGDLMTRNDAERIARLGVPSVQIQTRGSCHLDSRMIGSALAGVDLESIDLLFIENVGNLVCPTGFDLGEEGKVVLASVTDGADKPAKYPYIFEKAAAVILNKIDLLPYVPFDAEEFARALRHVNPRAPLFRLSCLTGEGFPVWLGWLHDRIASFGDA
jgi:hydrogenase nickel incorporation protein HypB